jgi:aspartyl-tRNA(Asn)/glutamyl-tRNA(Gln) amidotransferase subunit A
MAAQTPLAFEPVHQLRDRLTQGEITPVAIVEGYLDRIARYDAKLHAYIDVYADEARAAAHAAAAAMASGHRIGPFHGIPVAVKDLVEIAGRVTTGGCGAWHDRRSPSTATLVEKMVAAGMIVLGKTHTVQFAMGGWGTNQQFGTPWNPWDLVVHRTPGGSSAGSGVAVAAGLAPWAIGTDTGGSVRLPAAWCGVVGLKTTIGRISTYGVLPLAATLDTPGPIARDVEDAALLLTVLQGADPRDRRTRGVVDIDPALLLDSGVLCTNLVRES